MWKTIGEVDLKSKSALTTKSAGKIKEVKVQTILVAQCYVKGSGLRAGTTEKQEEKAKAKVVINS
jgi:hypothetical protein